jgi:hypothetical protein
VPTLPASRVEQFDVTIPANTPKAAPVEIPTSWIPGELAGVRIRIPNGHSFLTGIRLLMAHAQAIPETAGAWLQGNDDLFDLDLVGQLNTGAWSCQGFNTDIYPHTFHVTFYVLDFAQTRAPSVEPLQPTPLIA